MAEFERKILALSDAKASDAGTGSFSGYASLFGIKDDGGDVVLPGAYADTIPQFLQRGFISWGHDWNNPVATISDAHEDARGLFISAEFHSDPESQTARTRTAERIARGKFMGLSIGYRADDADYQPDARLLKMIHLYETGLVTVPMLAPAGVTDAKAQTGALDRVIEELKAGARNNRTDLGRIQSIHDMAVELDAKCALDDGEPKSYADHMSRVLALVDGALARTEAKAALRAGEGRRPGESSEQFLRGLSERLQKATGLLAGMAAEPKAAPDGAALFAAYQHTLATLRGVGV